MAFFKFRLPGQAASSTAPAEAVANGPMESIEVVRRRARHRLMGAVILVLIGVIGFPLLFDTQPRPVAVDTPIVIADRQTAPALTSRQDVPPEQAPAKPLLPEAHPLSAKDGLGPREELIQESKPASAMGNSAQASANADSVVPEPETKNSVPKTDVPATAVKVEKPEPTPPPAKTKDDGSKAKSLLDGKSAGVAERHVVQVGAFSDPVKVREIRRKLEQAGLSTFTQVIDGKDGISSTRVRVGPYDSREEADKVAARIRRLQLTAAVLRL